MADEIFYYHMRLHGGVPSAGIRSSMEAVIPENGAAPTLRRSPFVCNGRPGPTTDTRLRAALFRGRTAFRYCGVAVSDPEAFCTVAEFNVRALLSLRL
jgi:hypothetical protein